MFRVKFPIILQSVVRIVVHLSQSYVNGKTGKYRENTGCFRVLM